MRLLFALVVALGMESAAPTLGGIRVESEKVEVDRAASIARFSVRFDARPDFWTTDEFGRIADSFQYEIDEDWRALPGLPPEGLDAVVRGDEIRVADALRIRAAGLTEQPDPDPVAGGWGAVSAEVPFHLSGRELWFEAPLSAIGDEDGYFAYRLFTTEYGLTTSEVESHVVPPDEPGPSPIPLPPASSGAIVAVIALLALRLVRAGCRNCPN